MQALRGSVSLAWCGRIMMHQSLEGFESAAARLSVQLTFSCRKRACSEARGSPAVAGQWPSAYAAECR